MRMMAVSHELYLYTTSDRRSWEAQKTKGHEGSPPVLCTKLQPSNYTMLRQ